METLRRRTGSIGRSFGTKSIRAAGKMQEQKTPRSVLREDTRYVEFSEPITKRKGSPFPKITPIF